ncbi:MAG TPA: peptidoglycan DD-metalloendopeptidase family protein [Longimicrobium sp.]|nr:peptidoglycan DD-metalloendopeptidase family protein [Longimicrobium sp.]
MDRRIRRAGFALLLAAVALPLISRAQQTPTLTESQRRLQEIRRERTQLRGELSRIRSRVGDVSAEIRNIQRQQQVSASLLAEINLQMEETSRKIDETTQEMAETQAELVQKRRMLHTRLRGIYKRGPLHSAQVLLSSQSFSDLLNRYKYLYIVARRDRALVAEVDELARELENRERELRRSFNDIQYLRSERAQENATLQELRTGRTATLSDLRATERRTNARLETLARDERRLTGVLADLERRRREAEARAAAAAAAPVAPGATRPAPPRPAASTMTTADVGNLDWPVGGRLVYNFGRATQPNGTTIRYNGVGIGAAAGSPVRAIEAGTVEMAAPFEGYGPTVVISHGGGYYSLYLYLKDVHVRPGAQVTKGQTIGTVGGETSPEGPHLEFQIREPGGGAVDPVRWLRGRR